MWRLGEILIQKKLLSWDQLALALEEQKKTREYVGEILIRKGFVAPILVYKALAEQYQMRFVDLKRIRINLQAVSLIPRETAEKHELIPLEIVQKTLIIGIANPLNVWPESELKEQSGMEEIKVVLCLPSAIQEAVAENYPPVPAPQKK